MKNNVAILGASGMLGQDLVRQAENSKLAHVRGAFTNSDTGNYARVDVTNLDSLNFFIDSWKPTIIINSSAYTNVDAAEKDYETAMFVNAIGAKNLASVCKERGIYLAHVSTDYVFGGRDNKERERKPFAENEKCSPVGIYGFSKFFGEEYIRSNYQDGSLIVRTSWLHGSNGKNFIDTILSLLSNKEEIHVVNDQVGSLTWTPWLAEMIFTLVEKEITGCVHVTAEDESSWFDVADYLAFKIGSKCKVLPQSTEDSGRTAPRPAYSKLSTRALQEILGTDIPGWRWFVDSHLKNRVDYNG